MVRPNGNQDRWAHWTCMVNIKMDSTSWFRVITSLKAFSQLQQLTRPHPSWGRSIGPCSIKQPRIQQSSTESQPKAPKLREMPLIEPSALLELVYSGGSSWQHKRIQAFLIGDPVIITGSQTLQLSIGNFPTICTSIPAGAGLCPQS